MLFEFLGQTAAHAKHTGDRPQPDEPQRQRIKHTLCHVNGTRRLQGLEPEDGSLRAGQEQMSDLGRRVYPATIKTYQAVRGMEERNDHTAQEVLASLGVENAYLAERVAHVALG